MRRPGTILTTLVLTFLLSLVPAIAQAQEPGTDDDAEAFDVWLQALRSEALGNGIRTTILDEALADVRPIPRVVELDRSQPEFTLTFEEYMARVVPNQRVELGRQKLLEYEDLLTTIGAAYGVQPRFIVAFWGIETDFGRVTGGFPVIDSLATLAYDGRRSSYFRGELLNALQILNDGHIAPADMVGSWAGAMGQSQFMPSSFLNFAVDHNGDGRRDIWNTEADVFASAANYLAQSGWQGDQTWGRPVQLPGSFNTGLADVTVIRPISEWQTMGVRRPGGGALPSRNLDASIVYASGDSGPAFMVYDNFRATLRWNRSTFFALAIGQLADGIGAR